MDVASLARNSTVAFHSTIAYHKINAYRSSLFRQGDFSRLTVNVLSTNYSRTYSSYIGSEAASMTYPINSMIYLGGLSPLDMVRCSIIFAFSGPRRGFMGPGSKRNVGPCPLKFLAFLGRGLAISCQIWHRYS